jgi:CRP-like cAMP-binding protein
MPPHKPAVFPIASFIPDDRSGSGAANRGGNRGISGSRSDFRKLPLRKIPLLADAMEDTLLRLDRANSRVNFTKGQEIIRRSEQSRDVYILLSGQARVIYFSEGGKAVAFRRLDPGDIFGEFAAIDGRGRSATVEATTAATTLQIPEGLFWDILRTDHLFAGSLMRHLVALLRSLTSRIVEFSTLGVKNRIHSELLRMVKSASAASGRAEITPAPTHSDFAARISTHREAVSRELSRLAKMGVIERRGRTILVKDVDQLEQLVRDSVEE